jgi:hypothetical protein
LVRALFEPLGWRVRTTTAPFGPGGSWGDAPYADLTLTGTARLADALSQLYVLLPVLDNAKHYWMSSDEVDKLVRRGEGWLADHPERELIVRRYLRERRSFVEDATARLNALDDVVEPEADEEVAGDAGERRVPLRVQRLEAVMAASSTSAAARATTCAR